MIHADSMTQTEICQNNIETLKNQITKLETDIETLRKSIEELNENLLYKTKIVDEFSKLPLVPQVLIDWKTRSLREDISNVNESLKQQNDKMQNLKKDLDAAKTSLQIEKGRLGPIKNVVITYIKIKANGNWDEEKWFSNKAPDIRIKMKNNQTRQTSGRVAKDEDDSYSFEYKKEISTGSINEYDQLIVYDIDKKTDEEKDMGTIDLKKNEINPQFGVSGDSQTPPPITGSSQSPKGKIEYTIQYKVYY